MLKWQGEIVNYINYFKFVNQYLFHVIYHPKHQLLY